MHWYEIANIATIDSPALVIYQERVHENIQLMKQMVNNDVARLRPHVKTNKIAEVCKMMMDAGIYKFKCAKHIAMITYCKRRHTIGNGFFVQAFNRCCTI